MKKLFLLSALLSRPSTALLWRKANPSAIQRCHNSWMRMFSKHLLFSSINFKPQHVLLYK